MDSRKITQNLDGLSRYVIQRLKEDVADLEKYSFSVEYDKRLSKVLK